MFKRTMVFLLVLILMTACGGEIESEEKHFLAASENWEAEMSVTLPPPPEDNFTINITYSYTGQETDTNQRIKYNHILDWYDSEHPSFTSDGDFLPTIENPEQITLYDTRFLGGYEIGQKWITEVVWYENGKEVKEKLIFEVMEEK